MELDEIVRIYYPVSDAVASMHSFYANLPAIASVEALIDAELYCIAKEDLDRLSSESKELVTQLFAVVQYQSVLFIDFFKRFLHFKNRLVDKRELLKTWIALAC